MDIEEYKRKYAFGEDYGTSDYKFGPILLGERPDMIENRGYLPDIKSIMYRLSGVSKRVIVGPDVTFHLETTEDLAQRLIYPMRDGVIDKGDARAWEVVYEITKFGLERHRRTSQDFNGYYVTAALASTSPKYMYEKMLEIHERIDEETRLVRAATIIPQPLAVAIAEKEVTCVVLESGHGNTQICPISRYPIRRAIVVLNRGGAEANSIATEILKDCGYGDLVHEEKLIRIVKENFGLIPRDLDRAIEKAKREGRFRAQLKIPGTTVEIDLSENSWMRFLIGEFAFNPIHEIFDSYFRRGLPRPRDTQVGDRTVSGMLDMGEAIIESVSRCPVELQPHLYRKVILSGGNFAWKVAPGLEDVACDAATKVKLLLARKGIDADVRLTRDPQFSVWKGCIVYSVAVPDGYEWTWERLEGWYKWR